MVALLSKANGHSQASEQQPASPEAHSGAILYINLRVSCLQVTPAPVANHDDMSSPEEELLS